MTCACAFDNKYFTKCDATMKEYGIECFYVKEFANGAFKDFVRTLWFEDKAWRDKKFVELRQLNRELRFAHTIRKIERVCESHPEQK